MELPADIKSDFFESHTSSISAIVYLTGHFKSAEKNKFKHHRHTIQESHAYDKSQQLAHPNVSDLLTRHLLNKYISTVDLQAIYYFCILTFELTI